MRIDAWLCDLKDFAIKDGLHVYGRAAAGDAPERAACAEAERAALLAALDGRHVAPGPAGAPARGRTDVLPTGRNLYAADPRTLPTPTAFALGRAAADEVLRRHVQEHGDWPRALVIDLWGSASAPDRRRGDRAGAGADGLPAGLGRGDGAGDRGRGAAAGGGRAAAGRRDLADLGAVPRHVREPDRADRRRGGGGGGARGERGGEPAGGGGAAAAADLRVGAGDLRRGAGGAAGERRRGTSGRSSGGPISTAGPSPSAGPTARASASRGPSPSGWRRRSCWCIPGTIRGGTCSKARPTSPSSAASRRRWRRSAGGPIW